MIQRLHKKKLCYPTFCITAKKQLLILLHWHNYTNTHSPKSSEFLKLNTEIQCSSLSVDPCSSLVATAQVNFVSASHHNKYTNGGFVLQQTLKTLLAQTAAATPLKSPCKAATWSTLPAPSSQRLRH